MYITLETDYAVRIISCLAASEHRLDAKTISERTCVTLRFALKILRKLVAGGLVHSYKGTQGGYDLAKTPKEITLCDIVEITEGTYKFSRCLDGEVPCSRGMSGVCCYQKAFGEITDQVRKMLLQYNIEDLNKKQRK